MIRKSNMEPASTAPFRAIPLAEAHAEYGRMVERVASLSANHGALRQERKALEAAIAADTSPAISPSVAALLGDEPSPAQANQQRLAEVWREIADIDAALVIAERRKRDHESFASKAVCTAARPEMASRMAILLRALREVDAAHRAIDEVVNAIEAEGASIGTLGPVRPFFLGGSADPSRQIARFIRDAKEAGYGD